MYIIRSVGAFWIATPLITELQLQQLMLLSGYTGKSLTLCLCSVFHCKKERKNSLRWVCQGLNVSSGWPEIRSIKKKESQLVIKSFYRMRNVQNYFFLFFLFNCHVWCFLKWDKYEKRYTLGILKQKFSIFV